MCTDPRPAYLDGYHLPSILPSTYPLSPLLSPPPHLHPLTPPLHHLSPPLPPRSCVLSPALHTSTAVLVVKSVSWTIFQNIPTTPIGKSYGSIMETGRVTRWVTSRHPFCQYLPPHYIATYRVSSYRRRIN